MEEEKGKIKEIITRCPNCGKEIHFPYYNQPQMKIIYDLLEEHWKECSRKEIREIAESHWKYTSVVIQKSLKSTCIFKPALEINLEDYLELVHFLYVEAMVHGYKHCEDDARKLGYFEEKEIQE